MQPVIDSPNNVSIDAPPLESARPQSWGARPRVWRALLHGITTYLTPTSRAQHAPVCPLFEFPMDRLVQEHASLSLLALAIV